MLLGVVTTLLMWVVIIFAVVAAISLLQLAVGKDEGPTASARRIDSAVPMEQYAAVSSTAAAMNTTPNQKNAFWPRVGSGGSSATPLSLIRAWRASAYTENDHA